MLQIPTSGVTDRDRDQAIRQLVERNNLSGTVTLLVGTTTTTIANSQINGNGGFALEPATANAAAARPTTYSHVAPGLVTITHANNAQTDRTFYYIVFGG